MRFVHCLISIIVALATTPPLHAQVSPHINPDQAVKLQVPQPAPDISSPVTATAAFDPPLAGIGQIIFYRVALNGVGEAAVQWPGVISGPPDLKFEPVSQGQLMEFLGNSFRPLASFIYKVNATKTGHFTVPGFTVMVDGKPVEIPAASLDVDKSVSSAPPRRLILDISATNVFLGQPFRARVMLPASPANHIEALQEVQFNGNGFISDLTTMRQTVEMVGLDSRTVPAFIYEITLTPIQAGSLTLSAQGFAAGNEFLAPVTISGHVVISGGPPHYVLLASNPVQVDVRPLPAAGQPADFNGSIGSFTLGQAQLSTNRIVVGQPVRLTVAVRSSGTLNRLVPPAPPNVKDWEVIPDNPPDFSFTLIPLTDTPRLTPAIPFSSFDPGKGTYVDLTIPALPVTVLSEGLPTVMPSQDTAFSPGSVLKLGALSSSPGASVVTLVPPQLRGRFVGLQFVPILAILGLWRWDCRRRYLEAHPEIVRRRQARRLLRREKRRLRDAVTRADAAAIARRAANAMKIASAPHYAAHPQALVCSDVLDRLHDSDRSGAVGKTIRKVFAAADARFASHPEIQAEWPALQSDVYVALLKLEEQL
jgi:hypothetical protein